MKTRQNKKSKLPFEKQSIVKLSSAHQQAIVAGAVIPPVDCLRQTVTVIVTVG